MMRKKEPENVHETASKSKKLNDLKTARPVVPERQANPRPVKVADDPRFAQAVQNYEAGLKYLQAHKYDKAKGCFEKVVAGSSPELADRAATHLNICNQHLGNDVADFATPEEEFDYAVSLMNAGDYVGAREVLDGLTQKHAKLDFVWYGSAALHCLMGHFPDAISHLGEAIQLNSRNRFQARNDGDFKSLGDDPRFTELLYPDSSAETSSDALKWHF